MSVSLCVSCPFLKNFHYKTFLTCKKYQEYEEIGSSLVAEWLAFQAFTAMTQVQSLVRELRSFKPHGMIKKNIYVWGDGHICDSKMFIAVSQW